MKKNHDVPLWRIYASDYTHPLVKHILLECFKIEVIEAFYNLFAGAYTDAYLSLKK